MEKKVRNMEKKQKLNDLYRNLGNLYEMRKSKSLDAEVLASELDGSHYKMINSAPFAFATEKDGLKIDIYQGGKWKYGIAANHGEHLHNKIDSSIDFYVGFVGVNGYWVFGGESGGPGTQN